jgi:hypothetical protein
MRRFVSLCFLSSLIFGASGCWVHGPYEERHEDPRYRDVHHDEHHDREMRHEEHQEERREEQR